MRAGDLHRAGTELRIGIIVDDDRNKPAVLPWADRNFAQFADDRRIALVGGMNGNRAIAEHGFRPGGGNRDVVAGFAQGNVAVGVLLDIFVGLPAGERVFEMPHMAVDLDVLHFKVGNRRLEFRIPVDEPLAAIDQPFVIEANEDFQHRPGKPFVHGEAFARPVAGGTKPFQLVEDQPAGLVLPFPDAIDKGVAAHFAAARLLAFGELTLDDHLRGNAGMVHARLPQNVLATHALEADEDVLQRVVERVAHMQRAGDVGRRNDNAIGVGAFAGTGTGGKGVCLIPFSCNARFGACRIIGLV